MKHWKTLLDPGVFLGPQDFPEPRAVTIARIAREKMPARDGEPEQSSPMLYIQAKDGTEYPRKLKLPKTVLYGLSIALGPDLDQWVGKQITVYATTCLSFGQPEECLRVQFDPQIEAKVIAYCKKRKVNPKVYKI